MTIRGDVDSNAAYVEIAGEGKNGGATVRVPVVLSGGGADYGYAAATVTRPADTTGYTAGDVAGAAAAAISLTSLGLSGSSILITSASLEIDVASVPAGMTSFRLHLYTVTPPSALADNVAWDLPAGDRASYVGYIDLGTPVDVGSTLYVEANGINKQIKLAGTGLFGYLVTNGAYTPTSAGVKIVKVHAVGI